MEENTISKEGLEKHHGKKLEKIIHEKKYNIQVVADKMGLSRRGFTDWFKTKKFKKSRAIILKHVLDIDLKEFGYSLKDTVVVADKKKYKHTRFLYIKSYENKKEYTKSLDLYFKAIEKCIVKASKEIAVYDYLVKTNNANIEQDPEKIYLKRAKKYLKKIEKHIFLNRRVVYKRVLALPVNGKVEEFSDACFKRAIDVLFVDTFEHLWNCFNKLSDRFYLFVHNASSKHYSFAYIDKTIAITEHEKFDENNTPKPDMLFIHTYSNKFQDPDIKEFNRVIRLKFRSVFLHGMTEKPPVWRLDKETFRRLTKGNYDDIKNQLLESKKNYKALMAKNNKEAAGKLWRNVKKLKLAEQRAKRKYEIVC